MLNYRRHFVSGASVVQSLSRSTAKCAHFRGPAVFTKTRSCMTTSLVIAPRPKNAVSKTKTSLKIDGFDSPAFASAGIYGSKPVAPCKTTAAGHGSVDQVATAKEPIHLMLVSDLDFTMVDHEDKESTSQIRFNSLWAADYAHNSLLVFSTGRSPEKYEQLRREKPLITPSVGIFSVGTQILYGPSLEPDVGWEDYLNDGWNRDLVIKECQNFPALKFQEDSEQRFHKVSFYVDKDLAPDVIRDLTQRLDDLRLKVKLIHSGGYALDILPHRAGKGEALAYLLQQLKKKNMTPKATLVCGDSGNDAELYTVEGVKGVIVGNAMEELLQWYDGLQVKKHIFRATQRCAAGIIEAIEHFALGPYEVPADRVVQSSETFTGGTSNVKPTKGSATREVADGTVGTSNLKPTKGSATREVADVSVGTSNVKPTKGSATREVGDVSVGTSNVKPTKGSATREVVDINTALVMWVNGDCPDTNAIHSRILGVMAEDGTMVYPWGEERILRKSVAAYKDKYGLKKEAKLQVWMDCMKEQKLADNIFLVTWQYWQQLTTGENRKGYYATAILRTKVGNPSGLEWVRVHETPRT